MFFLSVNLLCVPGTDLQKNLEPGDPETIDLAVSDFILLIELCCYPKVRFKYTQGVGMVKLKRRGKKGSPIAPLSGEDWRRYL